MMDGNNQTEKVLFKSRVKAHLKRTKSGKIVPVREYEASRKKGKKFKIRGVEFSLFKHGKYWYVHYDGTYVDRFPTNLSKKEARRLVENKAGEWVKRVNELKWSLKNREKIIGFGKYAKHRWSDPKVPADYLYWLGVIVRKQRQFYKVSKFATDFALAELNHREQQFIKRTSKSSIPALILPRFIKIERQIHSTMVGT